MKYSIGLDIGIASIGYAALALDENEEPMRIISMGSRIFKEAEQQYTGASLALPRREARGIRRRLRRHKLRIECIRELIIQQGLLLSDELTNLFVGKLSDVYSLRAEALDRVLSKEEFARVLLHLAQRRGFKSNRKADSKDKEAGALLGAVQSNIQRMHDGAYRTVGEMMYKDEKFSEYKRNKSGDYITTVSRDMIAQEAKEIFKAQRSLGMACADVEFEHKYLEILLSQRTFDQGPGQPSPYAGDQIYKMVGKCTFEADEMRAAKACYSFEYFTLLQQVNHMRILNNGEALPLSREQRDKLISLAHSTASITYTRLRKELCIADSAVFKDLRYPIGQDVTETENKAKFVYMKAYHVMRKGLDKVYKGRIAKLPRDMLNEAGNILTLFKTDDTILQKLQEAGFEQPDIIALSEVGGFAKFGHLSVKACDKIIPFLEQGLNYNEACDAAQYKFKGHSSDARYMYLPVNGPELETLTNPVVRRAVAQTIKVTNALIRSFGESPVYVNIELAREMAKDFDERQKLKREMDDNAAKNECIMEQLRTEYGITNPTGQDLVKLKLYNEQDGICQYSLQVIEIARLFEPGYVEIDHIIPQSISFDDSYKNKVLVMAEENRQKGNRLPLEYLQGEKRDKFIVFARDTVRNYKKRNILLKEKLTEDDLANFKERNLQDTKTMSRFMYNYINDNLSFAPTNTSRIQRVTAINGSITSMLRKRYGISKIRADGDTHHAVDAVIIACTTHGMINKLSHYNERREMEYVQNDTEAYQVHPKTGEVLKRIPYPWPEFKKELCARLCEDAANELKALQLSNYQTVDIDAITPVFVSRMECHKVSGSAHKATIKSLKAIDSGVLVAKRPLSKLKVDKNGELADYYMPSSDTLLYNALKARLHAFADDAKAAFAEPFYKPKSDGSRGPLVKKVKLFEKASSYVPVNGGKGAADNATRVRIDVFYIEHDGYYMVPIYVADTIKSILPNKAVVAHKEYKDWKEMDDSNFVFSLYANDLIHISFKKAKKFLRVQKASTLPLELMLKEGYLYYGGCADISDGSISICTHNNAYKIDSLGLKTVASIQKCQVDCLGNILTLKRETRQYFNAKKNNIK